MPSSEFHRYLSAQAHYIHEKTKPIWDHQIVDPRWHQFKENDWQLLIERDTEFYRGTQKECFRVTEITSSGLFITKYENGYGWRRAHVSTNSWHVIKDDGSKYVEINQEEIFEELYLLNQAITLFLDKIDNPTSYMLGW
jgi:hypothetical protein